MPRLLIFLACEKVILAQDNGVSLIGLLQGLTAEMPTADTAAQMDEKSGVPLTWFVFTHWQREPDEANVEQEITYILTDPNGRESTLSRTRLKFEKRFHRHWTKVTGFPVKVPGDYTLNVLLRPSDDDSASARLVASYPLTLEHKVASSNSTGAPH
jgi:hypothetical protein